MKKLFEILYLFFQFYIFLGACPPYIILIYQEKAAKNICWQKCEAEMFKDHCLRGQNPNTLSKASKPFANIGQFVKNNF